MDFGKTQIGNMTFVKYKKGGLPFIKVSTVSGDFSVEYGAGSVMFMISETKKLKRVLSTWHSGWANTKPGKLCQAHMGEIAGTQT